MKRALFAFPLVAFAGLARFKRPLSLSHAATAFLSLTSNPATNAARIIAMIGFT